MQDVQDLFGIALRISIIYLYALILMRLTGKRSVGSGGGSGGGTGSLTPFDFAVGAIIGDLFDNVFWGTTPMTYGITAFAVIIMLHTLVSFVSYKNRTIYSVVASLPTMVIEQGKLLQSGLRKERTPADEVLSELRQNINDEQLSEVEEAYWEPSGSIGILQTEDAKPVQKKDLPRLLEMFK